MNIATYKICFDQSWVSCFVMGVQCGGVSGGVSSVRILFVVKVAITHCGECFDQSKEFSMMFTSEALITQRFIHGRLGNKWGNPLLPPYSLTALR